MLALTAVAAMPLAPRMTWVPQLVSCWPSQSDDMSRYERLVSFPFHDQAR